MFVAMSRCCVEANICKSRLIVYRQASQSMAYHIGFAQVRPRILGLLFLPLFTSIPGYGLPAKNKRKTG